MPNYLGGCVYAHQSLLRDSCLTRCEDALLIPQPLTTHMDGVIDNVSLHCRQPSDRKQHEIIRSIFLFLEEEIYPRIGSSTMEKAKKRSSY